jgi:predicted amidophosphoribosyltransferase
VDVEISQADLERLMENWSHGTPSPFYKRKERLRGDEPIAVATFADERVQWIGKVDTEMFSTRNNKDFGVYMGISRYRVVFYRAATVFSDLCRSYWFEIDTGGRSWQRGRVRKKEYRGAGLARPRFKKGVVGRQMVIAGNLTRGDGRADTVFEHELSGLEWLNPQSGKFEGRKGQDLYDQLIEAYDHRMPISAGHLWLMENDTRRAIVTPGSGAATGGKQPEAEAPTALLAAPADTSELQESPIEVTPVESEEVGAGVCPQCGHQLRPGIGFCGKCGYQLGRKEAVAEVEVAEKESADGACPECGHPLKSGIRFCGKCGHQLGEETPGTRQVEGPPEEEGQLPDLEKSLEGAETPAGESAVESEEGGRCPQCGRAVEEDWQVCPYCGGRLASECPECGKATQLEWVVCPYCGATLKDGQARLYGENAPGREGDN